MEQTYVVKKQILSIVPAEMKVKIAQEPLAAQENYTKEWGQMERMYVVNLIIQNFLA